MSQDLNDYSCTGRLTRDSELRSTNSGTSICTFSVAVNKRKRQQDGSYQDVAMFFECVLYGKLADSISQYLVKGQQVVINGSLDEDKWQDKNTGANRSKIKIIVSSVVLTGGSKSNDGGQNRQQPPKQQTNSYGNQGTLQPQQNTPQQSNEPVPPEDFVDDDIPF